MNKENYITDYVVNYNLDIEKMISDYRNYVLHIIENNSKGLFSYEDKEEIISDVFLSIWHNKKKIDNTKPLKNYIAGITKNLIKVKFKKINKVENEITLENEDPIDLKNIDIVYEQNEINKVIAEELNNMKKQEYQIFCKYYYLSKSINEIAEEMSLSKNNVKVKLHRVRKKLKTRLIKRGIGIKIASIILVLFAITGVVFAKEIVRFVKHIFINTSDGVESAIEKGYMQEVNMDYIQNNNIDIKVDYILMDDFNLDIMFNIGLKELKELSSIKLNNIVISDENGNILLTEFNDRDKYLEFCRKNKIENTDNYIALGYYNYSSLTYDYQNSTYLYSYIVRSENFPKSKKLHIAFDEIVLFSGNIVNKEILHSINGNFELDIDLDEKIYNRETLIYNLEYCNDNNLKLLNAAVSETGMKIGFQTIWGDPIYSNEDSPEEIERKKREFYDRPPSINDSMIKNEYVLNEDGKIFYPAHSSEGDGGYGKLLDGSLVYWQTFDLTRTDATNNLTIVLYKGGDWQKEKRRRNNYKIIKEIVKTLGESYMFNILIVDDNIFYAKKSFSKKHFIKL